MRNTIICYLVLSLSGIFSLQDLNRNDKLELNRIQFVIDCKNKVAKEYWKGFERKDLFGPMLYFSVNGKYIVNPNKKLKNKISYTQLNSRSSFEFGYISNEIDSTEMYMHISNEQEDKSSIYYKNPIAEFSDIILVGKFIPDITQTEEWVTMVVHEIFHQYQYSFKANRNFLFHNGKTIKTDSISKLYNDISWFKKGLENENEKLLNILNEDSKTKIRENIKVYLGLKKQRHNRLLKEENIDLVKLEDFLSRNEGTARYIEYITKVHLSHAKKNELLSKIDNHYSGSFYEDYNIENNKGHYVLSQKYWYAIGFNLTRLLEKLQIDYQETIFKKNKSFDFYLKRYLKDNRI